MTISRTNQQPVLARYELATSEFSDVVCQFDPLCRASAPKLKSKKKHPPVKYHLSIKGLEQQLPLGADRSKGLMLLYSFSGCDHVESFFRVGKATWIEAYKDDDKIPHIFAGLSTRLG